MIQNLLSLFQPTPRPIRNALLTNPPLLASTLYPHPLDPLLSCPEPDAAAPLPAHIGITAMVR